MRSELRGTLESKLRRIVTSVALISSAIFPNLVIYAFTLDI